MQSLSPTILPLLILVPLLVWRMVARLRRLVGRQLLRPVRPWMTVTIFPLLLLMLGSVALAHPERLALMLLGVALGAALGVYGLRKTQFEPTPQGLFYTPSAHIGILVSMLFAVRIAWRIIELALTPVAAGAPDQFARSPLTLAVFGLLAGYYVSYAIGLLRWRASVQRPGAAQ
jgi:hypothetical protein